jgi:hypothetical protein
MSVLSPTISKLYTPPTCTLEVTAKASPLSRWTGTPTVRSIQFLLSFDSLAQRARESVEIYGDQTQLSTLTETVTHYIQTVLASRPSDLPLSAPEQPEPAAAIAEGIPALRPSNSPRRLHRRPPATANPHCRRSPRSDALPQKCCAGVNYGGFGDSHLAVVSNWANCG